MTMREAPPRRFNGQTYEEACEWFVLFRAGEVDDQGRREFDLWLRRSPECVRAYLETAAIWNEAPNLDPAGRWDADSLIAAAGKGDVIDFIPPSARDAGASVEASPRRFKRRRWAVAAAVVLRVAIPAFLIISRSGVSRFETSTGEQRFLTLSDGSIELTSGATESRTVSSSSTTGTKFSSTPKFFHCTVMLLLTPLETWGTGTGNWPPARKLA